MQNMVKSLQHHSMEGPILCCTHGFIGHVEKGCASIVAIVMCPYMTRHRTADWKQDIMGDYGTGGPGLTLS